MSMKSIKIVLASPSDLSEERTLITNIVNNKDKHFKRQGITLDLRRWEDTVPGASLIGGQGTIDDDLGIEDADIFICLYWKKVGTIINELNETGTEHELNTAIQSFRKKGKPDIKFLLKKVPLAERDEDYCKIETIAKKMQPLALYKEFSSLDELKEIIDEILLSELFKKTTTLPQFNEEKKYVEASSETQLLAALQSNQRVITHNKFYDVLSCSPSSPNVILEDVFDGQEIIIQNLSNLTILGDQTKIITSPRYATVLTFKNCENISLSNLIIGHTPHKGFCLGSVLKFIDCNNVTLNNLELFGCGTYGIELYNTSNVTLNGCQIFECTYGAMHLDSSDLIIKNTTIRDCTNLPTSLFELEASYINMVNVLICDNETSCDLFSLSSSNIYGQAISICNNKFTSLGLESNGFFLRDNTILYSYPAQICSSQRISHDKFEEILEYVSLKSEIVRSTFDNGTFTILLNAPSYEITEEYSLYFEHNPAIIFTCG